jgi:hypothetical protein
LIGFTRRGIKTLGENEEISGQRFAPADEKIREEIGGILERAFKRESGVEPNEQEIHRFLILAEEAEKRAEAYEHLARQASEAAEIARSEDDLELTQLRESEAEQYSLEAETLRTDAERLRGYLYAHKF